MAKASDKSQTVQINGMVIQITWKQVKYLTLAVKRANVRVSAPLKTPLEEILSFINAKMQWIERQCAEFKSHCPHESLHYEDGAEYPVWGIIHILRLHARQPQPLVEVARDELHVSVRGMVDLARIQAALSAWRIAETRRQASSMVEMWRQRMGLKAVTFAVRHMKSRWGSCVPAKNKINLNAWLAQLPPICLESVIVHELCHCIVPSHGPKFYEVLGSYFPNWREAAQMLKNAAME